MIRKCFPYGKRKAFSITYDDGVLQDVPFVALLNKYGIPGTFSLNSGLMRERFSWEHPCGMTVTRLSPEEARELYRGHEVASHTLTHPYMFDLSREQILREMTEDKQYLEELFGREVPGFAIPFDYYSDLIRDCVQEAGFEYGRNAEQSLSFAPETDPFNWSSTVFHLNPETEAIVDRFLETDEELAICQIVGHSYDLDAENLWDFLENILRRIQEADDVLPMTHIDLVRYLRAMEQATVQDGQVENPSGFTLWFEENGKIFSV